MAWEDDLLRSGNGDKMKMRWRLAVLVVCWLAARHHTAIADDKTISEARDAIVARQAQLFNVTTSFRSETVDSPDIAKIKAHLKELNYKRDISIPSGTSAHTASFSFLSGKAKFDRELTPESARRLKADGRPAVLKETWIFTPARCEILASQLGDVRLTGSISHTKELPEWATWDLALGLRPYRDNRWLDEDAWKAGDIKEVGSDRFVISMKRNDLSHSWTFDATLGFSLISYNASLLNGTSLLEVECSDFRQVGSVFVPFSVRRVNREIMKEIGTVGSIRQTVTISVDACAIGDRENVESRYLMKWPKGTAVIDVRSGRNYVIKSGDRSLDDLAISEIEKKRAETLDEARRTVDTATPGRQPTTVPMPGTGQPHR